MKELKATRVPPGDRWAIVDDDKEKIYSSLTECLNAIFMQTGIGEHPDLLTEVDKYVEMLESASGKLSVLNKYFMIEEDKSVLKG